MRTLVLGGGGPAGCRLAERLAERGVPVRDGGSFAWEDRSSWASALEGVSAVAIVQPGAAEAVFALAEQTAARLVLLCRRGDESAAPCERALRDSGADWTILRASRLAQSFSEEPLLSAVRGGLVALPARPVGEPFVDAGDVADVAVAALTGRGHGRRVYELTGPRLLTFAEAVAEIADAAGREIRYRRVSPHAYAAWLAEHGGEPTAATRLQQELTEVLAGRNTHLADGVRRALGRAPRDFCEYAREAAAAGVWGAGVGR